EIRECRTRSCLAHDLAPDLLWLGNGRWPEQRGLARPGWIGERLERWHKLHVLEWHVELEWRCDVERQLGRQLRRELERQRYGGRRGLDRRCGRDGRRRNGKRL